MKILTGPLLVIAAALIWCGSATFQTSNRDGTAMVGALVAAGLLIYGLGLTLKDRERND